MRWAETGWFGRVERDEVGRYGTGLDGKSGTGQNETERGGTERNGTRWDGVGRDETGLDEARRGEERRDGSERYGTRRDGGLDGTGRGDVRPKRCHRRSGHSTNAARGCAFNNAPSACARDKCRACPRRH